MEINANCLTVCNAHTHTHTHGDTYRKRHETTQYVIDSCLTVSLFVLSMSSQRWIKPSDSIFQWVHKFDAITLTPTKFTCHRSICPLPHFKMGCSISLSVICLCFLCFICSLFFTHTSHHWNFLYRIEGYFKALTAAIHMILVWARSCRCLIFFSRSSINEFRSCWNFGSNSE